MEHEFTKNIIKILLNNFGNEFEKIFDKSVLLQYINIKTKSASSGSKSRGSFANLYAIYVLVEDYVAKGFVESGDYSKYEGASFSVLFRRQRELPFGRKLQNHALNHRMNEEFKKYFPTCEYIPILRDPSTNKYWINENLLKLKLDDQEINIARAIIEIIDKYAETKRDTFEQFIAICNNASQFTEAEQVNFIKNLLKPNVDARIFEIVSYAVLKYFYRDKNIYWGFDLDSIKEDNLKLYKTGRTNANDGGIDFVMKPLGRFFQVTETVDVSKYFLDIDKIERYPITFVVKSPDSADEIKSSIMQQANRVYSVQKIVDKYMACVEEIINVPDLILKLDQAVADGHLQDILKEIIIQSQVEFNYDDNSAGVDDSESELEE